ncbi:hypothetical protein L210DRAFT_3527452, partial [Boletus edulis BED1]
MSLERPSIPLLPACIRETPARAGGDYTREFGIQSHDAAMLHSDYRTFGKQHRSCKHPIHIPLVEWHCGKRTCHVNLVICVEE